MLIPATEVHDIKDIVDCPTMDNALNYPRFNIIMQSLYSAKTTKKERPHGNLFI